MMRKITSCLLKSVPIVFALLLIQEVGYSQRIIKGIVTEEETGEAIIGANIIIEGTSEGTSTNVDGRFSIGLEDENAILLISSIGYKSTTIPVAGKDFLEIKLEVDVNELKEVVISVGYEKIKKELSVGAVSSISGDELSQLPTTTVDQALQGRVAGLNVLRVDGRPGSQGIFTVRGNTSMVSGTRSQPLYVIDGVIMDPEVSGVAQAGLNPLALLNTNDVESIEVLKDAASAAIYGARAANGVIIVTTKRAKSNKPQINIRSQVGVSSRPALRPVMVGAKERRFKMDYLNSNLDVYDQRRDLSMMLTDSLNPAFNNNSDWQEMLMQTGVFKEIDLGVSGRTESSDYRFSLNYYNEEGVVKNSGFSRYSANLFYNFRPIDKLKVSTSISFNQIGRKQGNGDYLFRFSGWNFPSSFWQITDTERKFHTGALEDARNKNDFFNLNGNLNLQYSILENLTFTSNLVGTFSYHRTDRFVPTEVSKDKIARAYGSSLDNRYVSLENYINYNASLNDAHNVSLVLGQSFEQQYMAEQSAEGRNIPVNAIKNIQGLPDLNTSTTTYNGERSLASFFGRMSYDYKGKYILSGSYRMDGSSRFGKDNRWAQFSSLAGGWILSKESFWPTSGAVPFFKIRGSFGVTGREPGNFYQSMQSLRSDFNYFNGTATQSYNGGGYVVPNYLSDVSSPLLGWERSTQTNFGVEIGLFKDRIRLTGDYYNKYTADLLYRRSIPAITGYTNALDNAVDVLNKGWEIALTTTNVRTKSGISWTSNFTIAQNKNVVAKLPGGRDLNDGWFMLSQGQPLYTYRVWEMDGVYASTRDVPVDPVTGQRIRHAWAGGNQYSGGDPRRIDQNGDYVINDNDFVSYGNPDPKFYGGLNNTFTYKNFDLQVFCTFIYGRNIINGYLSDKLNGASRNANLKWGGISGPASDLGDYTFWEGPTDVEVADYPRIIPADVDQWHIQSSQFVEDGSFFKIKFISLGYNLPSEVAKRMGISNARIWGTMDNVWVHTKSTLLDPEAVAHNGYASANAYPIPHKFALGLQLSF